MLDSRSCAALATLIPDLPQLKRLALSKNHNIGQEGIVPLMTSLTAHNSLEKLLLGKTDIGVEDCQASSMNLKELDIGFNDLPPEGVELIVAGLHCNNMLEELHMYNSNFSLQNTTPGFTTGNN